MSAGQYQGRKHGKKSKPADLELSVGGDKAIEIGQLSSRPSLTPLMQ